MSSPTQQNGGGGGAGVVFGAPAPGEIVVGTTTPTPIQASKFTTFGIIAVGLMFWSLAQNATGQTAHLLNLFLFILLLSMVLLNWTKISPIFFKGGQ